MTLIINSKEFATVANKLDRLSRSDLPIAVRSTLNNMAFRMQKSELRESARKEFDYTRTNIVQNLSYATKAQGFNMRNMKSEAGIRERPNRQRVAKGLASQEFGGEVESKTVPTKRARGGSESSKVRPSLRLGNKAIVDARLKRRSDFISAASAAKKSGSLLMTKTNNSQVAAIARVSRFTRRKKKNPNIKLTWLYRYQMDDKKINPADKRQFTKRAYQETMKHFSDEFYKQADIRFQKALRK